MKRKTIQRVCIEEVNVNESFDRLFLWCRSPKGYVETSILFDKYAPRHSYKFQQWRLIQHLFACYGIEDTTLAHHGWLKLRGKHFLFELIEIQPRVWKINKAKAAEPIDFEAIEAEGLAALEELIAERRAA